MLERTFLTTLRFFAGLLIAVALAASAGAHSGIVDGYGCHRGPDRISYHCHSGQFAGRTFKSKEDFLRELRGAPSPRLSPKNNPPQAPKKIEQ